MKKLCRVILTILVLVVLTLQCSHAGLLYSKPAFRGRVIDAETKQPVEGTVVVILYDKWPIIGGFGGQNSHVFKAKETLTNSKGEFNFSSVNSLSLSTMDAGTRFIFFKPGYEADCCPKGIGSVLFEKYFSVGKIGEILEIEGGTFEEGSYVKWKGPLGIMELKKAITREEKLRTMPSPPTDYTSKELPILIKVINAEYNNLGIEGGYK